MPYVATYPSHMYSSIRYNFRSQVEFKPLLPTF